MRTASVYVHGELAGQLIELDDQKSYRYTYLKGYNNASVSLTMPTTQSVYEFDQFPPFFEGLLPEGVMLEGLLRQLKIDADDFFSQLVATGADLVGAVTVKAIPHE
ncbi:MAG: HipA N-terminal domain-containing protein [Bacteroidota bacterium]